MKVQIDSRTDCRIVFTREELKEKLGVDISDCFWVKDTGLGISKSVELYVFDNKAYKYRPDGELPTSPVTKTRKAWWKFGAH